MLNGHRPPATTPNGSSPTTSHLRRVLDEYLIHYNGHRPHLALGQHSPNAGRAPDPPTADLSALHVQRTPILGGLINEYHQAAPAWRFRSCSTFC
jgi:hypothetical protein